MGLEAATMGRLHFMILDDIFTGFILRFYLIPLVVFFFLSPTRISSVYYDKILTAFFFISMMV